MIVRRRYDQVRVGDYVRDADWPTFHQVERVTQTLGLVTIEVGVGGLLEKLPPRYFNELIETDRSLS